MIHTRRFHIVSIKISHLSPSSSGLAMELSAHQPCQPCECATIIAKFARHHNIRCGNQRGTLRQSMWSHAGSFSRNFCPAAPLCRANLPAHISHDLHPMPGGIRNNGDIAIEQEKRSQVDLVDYWRATHWSWKGELNFQISGLMQDTNALDIHLRCS